MKISLKTNRSTTFLNYLNSASGEYVFNKDYPTSVEASNITYVLSVPSFSVVPPTVQRPKVTVRKSEVRRLK